MKLHTNIPCTPRLEKLPELVDEVALELGHSYTGTEHVLLAFFRTGGTARRMLDACGVKEDQLRQALNEIHDPHKYLRAEIERLKAKVAELESQQETQQ